MNIRIENRQKAITVDSRKIRRTLTKLLRSMGEAEAEVSLLLVDDEGIREINRSYLNRDYPTNVISFSMREGNWGQLNPDLLGDIVVSVETARRDGERSGLSFTEAVDFLLIHGLLHLLGYDHEGDDPREKRRMEEKEEELFFLLHNFHLQR
ncbi:MAG TPA: rRNA maturation RNase YbeY [Syntrophales bacterium]|jgi:probable rRNA maturation factor|nr:rRNA maturation RNase YbeY [Syntrophales bacterium]HOO41789.1 rRNA maturation RNase YbeY [Syntrophales bacterium]HOU76635.1 rRNA maturation RNase YbeY [Syntrophales bacterium]HPC31392.1 rRNA maturation RNase YbeY [Syntrophales bacterium]HQG33298.1 rRNA maturation RNase YbeY [Syntrophales bacterium]